MKKIEAIIRHFKLEDVKQALTQIVVYGMSVRGWEEVVREEGIKG